MLKSLFCADISVEYKSKSEKFKRGIDRLQIRYNLDLSENTTEFRTLPMRPRSHRYILIYMFAKESVKICCLDVSMYMLKCVLLRYYARK